MVAEAKVSSAAHPVASKAAVDPHAVAAGAAQTTSTPTPAPAEPVAAPPAETAAPSVEDQQSLQRLAKLEYKQQRQTLKDNYKYRLGLLKALKQEIKSKYQHETRRLEVEFKEQKFQ